MVVETVPARAHRTHPEPDFSLAMIADRHPMSFSTRHVLLIVLMLGVPMPAMAGGPAVPESAKRYGRDLAAIMTKPGPVALEPIYDEGLAVEEAYLAKLSDFDEPTFHKLEHIMIGFSLAQSDEGDQFYPQWDVFLDLARKKGTKADLAFFAAKGQTYPNKDDWPWPAYIDQQTDDTGCTILDGKTLTGVYGVWIKFQASYPNQYKKDSQEERAAIEDEVNAEACVCGEEPNASKEFATILKTYPGTPLATKAKLLVDSLRDGTSDIRFSCLSG
jgi:hypothetical protein